MRSCKLTGLRQMQLVEVPKPGVLNPADVLIRVACVGVCGSDVHYYTTGRIGSQVVQYPFAVGHEFAGTVEAVGRDVRTIRPGDRVAVNPAMPCHTCDQCRAGRPHTCRKLSFLGCPGQAEGCLCDWIVMPAETCIPLPAACSFEQGALIEPLAIGAYGARLAGDLRGRSIAILGCGPIGLSVLLAARLAGVERIFVSEPLEIRRAFARRCGAAWGGAPDDALVKDILRQEPLGMDAVLECCGQQAALDQAVELLKPGGTLVLVGIPEVDRVSFNIDLLRRREITIRNVRRQNGCDELGVELVKSFPELTAAMVTHRFPAAQTQAAFDLVAGYQDGVVKAMVQFA
jgi:L-iditol 2-dehydrogenase